MRRLLLALAVLAPVPALAESAAETVRGFYREPLFSVLDPERRQQLTQPALGVIEANAASTPEGEIGCIDFNMTVDGQDYDAEEIARTLELSEAAAGEATEVTARFQLFGEPRAILWTLREEGGEWRVADVASAGWRLSEFDCE